MTETKALPTEIQRQLLIAIFLSPGQIVRLTYSPETGLDGAVATVARVFDRGFDVMVPAGPPGEHDSWIVMQDEIRRGEVTIEVLQS